MSETSRARNILAPFCTGTGIDIGCGGDPITPTALRADLANPYTKVGDALPPQLICDHTAKLPFIQTASMDFIYSSHLVEDFVYDELVGIIGDWIRCLKPGGNLVICAPDQQEYLRINAAAGIPADDPRVNQAHMEPDFSCVNFSERVMSRIQGMKEVFAKDFTPDGSDYSWCGVWERAF